ncbi:MAG: Hsp20/alpha crystallin family protein [Nocardioidaceae bacterium]
MTAHRKLALRGCPRGIFSRQLILGDNLDTEQITAQYSSGVLGLRIQVAEKAKARKIAIESDASDGDSEQRVIGV